ncbi:MAG TPA: hypothetical protein VK206_21385, partial [Anaerolineales bacterium]|nr:hypothetical protein [Anaerolineales bacterium]
AALLFTRGAQTRNIWFYDMAHDGFSLDDKRVKVRENDIDDILDCWRKRFDKSFIGSRDSRIGELRKALAPLKEKRLELHREIDEFTFFKTLTDNMPGFHPAFGAPLIRPRDEEFDPNRLDNAQRGLAALEATIKPLQDELNQLTRQFWVTKEQVKANKYDLSASRYRQVETDGAYYADPSEIIDRLLELDEVMKFDLLTLKSEIDPSFFGNNPVSEREADDEADTPF